MRHLDLSLYLVLDPHQCRDKTARAIVDDAIRGGVSVVQLRDKEANSERLISLGRAIIPLLKRAKIPLIINDDIEAVVPIEADGLHIGQGDVPAAQARERVGPERFLGLSVETVEDAKAADPNCVDYLGAGPIFPTASKSDHKTPIGFAGLGAIISSTKLPCVAIGGLNSEHVRDVFAQGAMGLAVISAICAANNPYRATKTLRAAIDEARPERDR